MEHKMRLLLPGLERKPRALIAVQPHRPLPRPADRADQPAAGPLDVEEGQAAVGRPAALRGQLDLGRGRDRLVDGQEVGRPHRCCRGRDAAPRSPCSGTPSVRSSGRMSSKMGVSALPELWNCNTQSTAGYPANSVTSQVTSRPVAGSV